MKYQNLIVSNKVENIKQHYFETNKGLISDCAGQVHH